jgi:hypothetical protein
MFEDSPVIAGAALSRSGGKSAKLFFQLPPQVASVGWEKGDARRSVDVN